MAIVCVIPGMYSSLSLQACHTTITLHSNISSEYQTQIHNHSTVLPSLQEDTLVFVTQVIICIFEENLLRIR
ncbi:MAG: hypothetical protein ACKPKO_35360, partial [Candidatus Fonsibacter sp.]